jgi:hypothetical protein
MLNNAAFALSPPSAIVCWLERYITSCAQELVKAGCGRPLLVESIQELFSKMPIQEWEADRWARGVRLRLLKTEAYFFRAGKQKKGAISLFVRNEQGLNVGLRREAITQIATYITLVTDFGYPRKQTWFESRFMDVAVRSGKRDTWIYAETKANERTLEKLCKRLTAEFENGLPPESPEPAMRIDDAINKANHILNQRPRFFWGVAPTKRLSYEIIYGHHGFRLSQIPNVPHADEWRKLMIDPEIKSF